MPGAHTHIYSTVQLNLIIYTNPWPRIMDSAGKRKESTSEPANGPPLQARVAAANRTVQQLPRRSWRTWNKQGAKQNERGQNVEKGSGHGMAKASRQTKPAEQATAGGHSRRTLRPAQASKHNSQQLAGLAAKTTAAHKVGRPLAVQCR